MLKNTEYRIGNLVKEGGFAHVVEEINEKRIREGMPVTHEILIRWGFVDRGGYYEMYYGDENRYLLYGLSRQYLELCSNGLSTAKIKAPHFHVIQNIYHMLTGSELKHL